MVQLATWQSQSPGASRGMPQWLIWLGMAALIGWFLLRLYWRFTR
jgi:hypothetical protein